MNNYNEFKTQLMEFQLLDDCNFLIENIDELDVEMMEEFNNYFDENSLNEDSISLLELKTVIGKIGRLAKKKLFAKGGGKSGSKKVKGNRVIKKELSSGMKKSMTLKKIGGKVKAVAKSFKQKLSSIKGKAKRSRAGKLFAKSGAGKKSHKRGGQTRSGK